MNLFTNETYIINCKCCTFWKWHLCYSNLLMLWSAGLLLCFSFWQPLYQNICILPFPWTRIAIPNFPLFPLQDLIVTGIFAFLWLVCSSAWGKGLTDVKYATNPERLMTACLPPDQCEVKTYPSMGRLNSSVVRKITNC